ncbi:UDP-galactose transporter senju-like isoform X2 [Amphibalanus amphitrite]|uniref:UDP-galactose transporter senju-like isoform X2 n=1 Tax=Amphibalanus amphitrite TaxID=1232801 RepID=UPI001C9124D9|nr:UDP-galactose transporter senju-like isoform X2 [Amphibalanus amphitrite]XP_043228827.1 UDP-galactose transporter senju-like isoform X2 [Amphibalanus amphitrite]
MSLAQKLRDLFPTKWSLFIFIAYMALFINQGILVTATKNKDNSYDYNTVTVVILTEFTKLFMSLALYLHKQKWQLSALVEGIIANRRACLLYLVPAVLYCIYNMLTFVNLKAFDPTTYFLLLQLRVVVTGVMFQVLFKRRLSGRQWFSLLLLTLGCVIKQLNFGGPASAQAGKTWHDGIFSINLLLILVQVFCSCTAGVYNEYLLKQGAAGVDVMLQNAFMYADSIVFAVLTLAVRGELSAALTASALRSVARPAVLMIVFNNATVGIVTCYFLHSLDSILKTFASALELMFTAVLCWMIFGIPVYANTAVAIAIVSAAICVYAQQPVRNPPPAAGAAQKEGDSESGQPLLRNA